jgi:hypothetical protein
MKTFLVPMFAIVQAETADAAYEKVGVTVVASHNQSAERREDRVEVYLDERLNAWAFDSVKWEPHSVLDQQECAEA